MKILISWYAYKHDFNGNQPNQEGPTFQFHRYFFEHDQHIILSQEAADDIRLETLVNALKRTYQQRKACIKEAYLNIANDDIIKPSVIRPKIEALLQQYADDELDLFISPGTPAMQVVWYLCHASMGLRTRLLQTRAPRHGESKPVLIPTEMAFWPEPVAAVIKENLQQERATSDEYVITPSIRPVYERAEKVAAAERVTCLIQGESGTGKEHLATYIHQRSARATRPFVAVNCSAFGTNDLLESRLFGYVKGAFTGATHNHDGFFAEANGGTIFLDEIGDISPLMQQALLRVVQVGEFIPVGATKPRKVDVRIIAATHRDLRRLCAEGVFRWDLFYRLSVAELQLPTLQERGSAEKRSLIDHFLSLKQGQFRRQKRLRLSTAVYALLDQYAFPGNVRELENLIESLYVFCDGTVEYADLPTWLSQSVASHPSFNVVAQEEKLVRQALAYYAGNQSKACAALGYKSINTLVGKMKLYGLK